MALLNLLVQVRRALLQHNEDGLGKAETASGADGIETDAQSLRASWTATLTSFVLTVVRCTKFRARSMKHISTACWGMPTTVYVEPSTVHESASAGDMPIPTTRPACRLRHRPQWKVV
jgi:hypothetical protein